MLYTRRFRRLKAFTLAEVLITLGIIGVVAAITVPTLINNAQKKEYVSRLQKTYSMLNQAFKQYAADQGCTDMICTGLFSGTTTANEPEWDNFFNNYLKVAKNCGRSTNQGCFPTETYLNYAGTNTPDSDGTYYKVILADGQSLGIRPYSDAAYLNCTRRNTAGKENDPLYQTCGEILLDTNGMKGPNKAGRDYFFDSSLVITNTHGVMSSNGSVANGGWSGPTCVWPNNSIPNYYCGTDAPSYGGGCAARIIEQSWEMNY